MESTDLLKVNGVSLQPQTRWCHVEDMSPLMASPGRRGNNVSVPGRHGVVRTRNKRATANEITVPLIVFGRDPATGATATDSERQLHQNIDTVCALFGAETSVLTHSWDGAGERRAVVELRGDPITVARERSSPAMARVEVPLTILDAFWSDSAPVTQTVAGVSGTVVPLTAFAGATAPMSDLLLTAYGPVNNPTWAHGDWNVSFGVTLPAGRQLVINTANWTVNPGTGTAWAPDLRQVVFSPGPRWFELNPAVQPFSVTFSHTTGSGVSATSTIAGVRRFLTP